MNVTRNVIIDLLPLYSAGEVSPDTRAMVDEYLKDDPELARLMRSSNLAGLASIEAKPAEDAEVKSLRRTRGELRWQRILYAWALVFSLLPFSSVFHFAGGHIEFHFLFRDYPAEMSGCVSLAITCWIIYFVMRRRLRLDL